MQNRNLHSVRPSLISRVLSVCFAFVLAFMMVPATAISAFAQDVSTETALTLYPTKMNGYVGTAASSVPSVMADGVALTEEQKAEVAWTSSDENVFTVASDGTITGVAVGTATLSATWNGKTATCAITVKEPSFKISSCASVVVGETSTAITMYGGKSLPDDKKAEVAWTSSDENVFTVATDGTIRGVAVGTATLSATWNGETATKTIAVKAPIAEFTNVDGETKYVDKIESLSLLNGTYKLLDDYTLRKSQLELNELATNVTIDLNGHNITINGTSENPAIYLSQENSAVTITGEGTITDYGNAPAVIGVAAKNCNVSIGKNVTLKSANGYGVKADSGAAGSIINVKGTVDAKVAGVYVNENIASSGATVNIEDGATVTGETAGIYAAGLGTYNIKGGTVSGGTGIYAKAGKISISGGSITATGDKASYSPIAGGFESTGDAVVLDSMTGAELSAKITAGTFTSENASAIACYTDDEAINPISKPVISGGTFSSPVDESYCAASYFPTVNADGTYGVIKFAFSTPTNTGVLGNTYIPTLKAGNVALSKEQMAEVAWTSSDENVFTVATDGTITYVAVGEAKLTAKWNGMTATYAISVIEAVAEYTCIIDGEAVTKYVAHLDFMNYGTYKLLKDYTPTYKKLEIRNYASASYPTNVIIDLNGHNIKMKGGSGNPIILISRDYNNLTITGEGTITDYGNAPAVIGIAAKNCNVSIGKNVTLKSANGYGVKADSGAAGSIIAVKGTVEAKAAGVYVNENIASSGATVNIEDGAIVTGEAAGIYAAGLGTYNIKGGTVSGGTGIYAKAGKISISGGSISATGDKASYSPIAGGFESTGDSVVLDSMTGASLSVSVTDGSLTSENAFAIACYTDDEATNPISKPVISGGTFSSPVDESYCAEGYIPTASIDGTYGVKVGEYVVRIGQQGYETFADALGAHKAGDVIKLLKDQTPAVNLSIGDSFTIDLNGFTFDDSSITVENYAYISKTNNADGTITYVVKAVIDTVDTIASAANASVTSIKVTWNVSKLATGYKLYYRVAGGKYALVKDFANNTTKTYTVTGLTCGKTYYFKVVPYVVSASSEVVDGAAAYTGAKKLVPGKVTLTSAKSTKSKTITVTFKKITGVTGYEIYYKNWKNTSPYYKRVTGSTTSITKSITNLASGNKYTVKVRAYKTIDGKRVYGAWSSYVYVTVK